MSFARFRNLKIRRANQAAEYPCINGVQEVANAADGVVGAISELERHAKIGKRVEDEMNCLERDKHIRLAEFKKRMAEQELVTVQRTLMRYGMTQLDVDEYEQLKSQAKRPTPEQKAAYQQELNQQSEDLKKNETTYSDMQTESELKQAESRNMQLREEISLLKKNLSSLQKELDSQKKLTHEMTLNKIHEEETRREKERVKRQRMVY
eukprot:TRINITY_DN5801_c0_g1_i1.p1 TRINITY_DN5801_c0_g1~~TRINITY_DN5801_c0_g1_i1.p1  ORF type:complete len:229 (+),score=85.65 TRINITY_DN5801_c0_g1_i1:66-689(+)